MVFDMQDNIQQPVYNALMYGKMELAQHIVRKYGADLNTIVQVYISIMYYAYTLLPCCSLQSFKLTIQFLVDLTQVLAYKAGHIVGVPLHSLHSAQSLSKNCKSISH